MLAQYVNILSPVNVLLFEMISLSEEQLRKIQENKAAALLKKQQAIQNLNKNVPNKLTFTQNRTVKRNEHENFSTGQFEGKVSKQCLTAVCKLHGDDRFLVDMPYHEPSIQLFKTINGRIYESNLKKWSFPLTEQSSLVSKLKSLKSDIVVDAIPDSVAKVILSPDLLESEPMDWSRIDKTLRETLMPFQIDGIRFGVSKKGRCLIADDMGLGKTIQALGIAHYFKANWPLLIVCPSSMRYPWEEAIRTFLPSVENEIQILTCGKDKVFEGDIVISSYDMMKNLLEDILRKRFGCIIFDESHYLKNLKTARTKAALELSHNAKNLILLSGTPALSRPQELYPQIFMLDPFTFKTFFDFGMRYCNGKKDMFGWNFSGSSNLEELILYLKKKIMIRRMKSDVIKQLPSKIRKVVILNPIDMGKKISKKMKELESDYEKQTGTEKHNSLLSCYLLTGNAKLKAVCEYIEDKLENENKFLVFAHHAKVISGICDFLEKKKVDHIKIDGSVSSEARKLYCDKFQTQKNCRAAVLSITAANCGITLTAAQLVIFAELYWNPGTLTQAEDRAHRIGQQDSVLVEYLVAKGTADDKLWNLIQSKLNTLNKIGLSKDNFKDSATEHQTDPNQAKITTYIQSLGKGLQNDSSNEKLKNDFIIEENDDDIFSCINLEEIDIECNLANKKMRMVSEI